MHGNPLAQMLLSQLRVHCLERGDLAVKFRALLLAQIVFDGLID